MNNPWLRTGLAVVLFACSHGDSRSPADLGRIDSSEPPDLGPSMASHTPFPVVPNQGGPVLKNPEVWTVVWKGDEASGNGAHQFMSWMLGSSYWIDALTEYGVAAGTGKGVIVLPDSAPSTVSDAALGAIADQLAGQSQYSFTANTLFAFVIPPTTTLTAFGMSSCSPYHFATTHNTPYAVFVQCANSGSSLTESISHEVAEAATDPFYATFRAAWLDEDVLMGEVADLCMDLSTRVSAGGDTSYEVSRLYSSRIAMEGDRDPCLPAAASSTFYGISTDPQSIEVAVDSKGDGSRTVDLRAFSFGEVGRIEWHLSALSPAVELVPASGKAAAGETIPLTVKVHGAKSAMKITVLVKVSADAVDYPGFGYVAISVP